MAATLGIQLMPWSSIVLIPAEKKRSNYMSSVRISKLVKSALTISSNKQALEINSAGKLCINSWLSIIMHLPHSDGDLPLADWQMFNNWGPKFNSYNIRTNACVNNKEGGPFCSMSQCEGLFFYFMYTFIVPLMRLWV